MFCPQCGQQQVSDITRFCARCGFPLEGVMAVLSSGGALPARYLQPEGSKPLSARSKGVRQGALLMLSTLLLVPLVAVITVFFNLTPELLVPITSITLFVGGLFRILYALLMEDPVARVESDPSALYSMPAVSQFDRAGQNAALPPASAGASTGWRPRPNTAEIYQPPSITENTTRLLDKDEPKSR